MNATMLRLDKITADERCQPRARLCPATVARYKEDLDNGAEFPPVTVFFDGHVYWLADGYLRRLAHQQAGRSHLACDVRKGGLKDAQMHAAGANATHGLQRTQEDKRRAVYLMLEGEESKDWPVTKIAKHTSTSHAFVSAVKKALTDLEEKKAEEEARRRAEEEATAAATAEGGGEGDQGSAMDAEEEVEDTGPGHWVCGHCGRENSPSDAHCPHCSDSDDEDDLDDPAILMERCKRGWRKIRRVCKLLGREPLEVAQELESEEREKEAEGEARRAALEARRPKVVEESEGTPMIRLDG